jgi:transcriptional regulator with XRE-family HTH domain
MQLESSTPFRKRTVHPLKARIRELGILQADLAEDLCCSEPAISTWLNSSRKMPMSVERRLREIIAQVEGGNGPCNP